MIKFLKNTWNSIINEEMHIVKSIEKGMDQRKANKVLKKPVYDFDVAMQELEDSKIECFINRNVDRWILEKDKIGVLYLDYSYKDDGIYYIYDEDSAKYKDINLMDEAIKIFEQRLSEL